MNLLIVAALAVLGILVAGAVLKVLVESPRKWVYWVLISIIVVSVIWMAGCGSSESTPVSKASQCEEWGKRAFATVAVCPKGLSDVEMKKAGQAICERKEHCNVWIWSDPDLAPQPSRSTMTAAHLKALTAIWKHDRVSNLRELIVCARSPDC